MEEKSRGWLSKPEVWSSMTAKQTLGVTLSHKCVLQVALHFVELYFDEAQKRIFDVQVSVNSQMSTVLTNFDIYSEAGKMPPSLCWSPRAIRIHFL